MNNHLAFILIIVFVALTSFVWRHLRASWMLKRWAEENGYEVVHKEYRNVTRGPYSWNSRGQAVFYVRVRDKNGGERTGWVNCGGRLYGLLIEKAQVQWEDAV